MAKKIADSAVKRPRKKNQSNEMLCRQRLAANATLIKTGKVLCIDPSSGSQSSMPGYAIFENSQLIAAGTIDINFKLELRVRLRLIHEALQPLLAGISLVLIEEVPVRPIRTQLQAASTGKTWMNAKAHGSLIQSVGATKAAIPTDVPCLNLPSTLWHRTCREVGWGMDGNNVKKSDVLDAIRIGFTAIHLVGGTPLI